MLPFQDHFLGIGDDQVEAGLIQNVEGHARFIQKVKADIGVEPANIFWWDDVRFIEGLDLAECLKHGRVGRENQSVMAVFGVFREFVGENELVEDADGHEDSFARTHSQCEDIVRVVARVGLQATVNQIIVLSGWFLKHTQLSTLTKPFIFCDKATF